MQTLNGQNFLLMPMAECGETIAAELVQNQLVRVVDAAPVATAIDYLLGNPSLGSVAFPLVCLERLFFFL